MFWEANSMRALLPAAAASHQDLTQTSHGEAC
jgi:hypothetical protein